MRPQQTVLLALLATVVPTVARAQNLLLLTEQSQTLGPERRALVMRTQYQCSLGVAQPLARPCTSGNCWSSDMTIGPDGRLYVLDFDTSTVERFDADTGAALGTFANCGANNVSPIYEIAFGRYGDLYVGGRATTSGSGSIFRFSGSTGAYQGLVFNAPSDLIADMAPAPDGTLIVSTIRAVRRIDAYSGNVLTTYYSTTGPRRDAIVEVETGGTVLVWLRWPNELRRYDVATGALLAAPPTPAVAGLVRSFDVAPNGNLIVAADNYDGVRAVGRVQEFSPTTGAMVRDVLPSVSLSIVWKVLFAPQPAGITIFGTATSPYPPPPCLIANSSPRIGNSWFTLTSLGSPLGTSGLLMLSSRRLTTAITTLGFDLWVDPSVPNVQLPVRSDMFGLGALNLAIPPEPLLVGLSLYGQFVWYGTPGFSATHGVGVQIQM